MSLAALRTRVEGLVRAERVGLDLGVDAAIREAVLTFSLRRPRTQVVDLVGTGEWYLPLPEGWDADSSSVTAVEYPVGRRPPALLSAREYWAPYTVPGVGDHLAFRDLTPAVGEAVRLTHTGPHLIEEDSTTLPEAHWGTVAKLAAGTVCLAIAAHYSHRQDATVRLDGVKHGTMGGEFAKRGEQFLREAQRDLPELEAERVSAAGGEVSFAGEIEFLTH